MDPERWRNPGYLAFLREYGKCIACMGRFGPCDPAHGPVNGTGSKGPDAEAIPLCRMHHDEQHKLNWPAFAALYGFNREKNAVAWWTLYQLTKEAA